MHIKSSQLPMELKILFEQYHTRENCLDINPLPFVRLCELI